VRATIGKGQGIEKRKSERRARRRESAARREAGEQPRVAEGVGPELREERGQTLA